MSWAEFNGRCGTHHTLSDLRILYAQHPACNHSDKTAIPAQPYRDFTPEEARIVSGYVRINFTKAAAGHVRAVLNLPASWSRLWICTLIQRPMRGNTLAGPGVGHLERSLEKEKQQTEKDAQQQNAPRALAGLQTTAKTAISRTQKSQAARDVDT